MTRTCRRCGGNKALTEFTKHPRSKAGRTYVCYLCDRGRQNFNSRAYRLRKAGYNPAIESKVISFEAIAKSLGISFNEARNNYYSGMAKLKANPAAAELLQLLQQGPVKALGGREGA